MMTRLQRARIERRLRDVTASLAQTREDLRILEEQMAYVGDLAEDAKIRGLVSDAPFEQRESSETLKHAAAMERQRKALEKRVSALEALQEELLDRLPPGLDEELA